MLMPLEAHIVLPDLGRARLDQGNGAGWILQVRWCYDWLVRATTNMIKPTCA